MPASGVDEGSTEVSQGGIGGFFGAKERMKTYSAGQVYDPNYEKNAATLRGMADKTGMRGTSTMAGTQVGQGGQIDTSPNSVITNQRLRQNAMLDQFSSAANGQGPSAAQAQLKMGADRAMASNLAMAAHGGTPAASRQAAFNNAAATQDLAGQSAILRAQEMQQARGLYAGALSDARGLDAGLATQQAQLNQQRALTQAGLNQDTSKTNLVTGMDQQKQKDSLIQQYLLAGMTLDQANNQANIQQRQFNAGLMAQQEAAGRGVSAQNTASANQTAGAAISALGTFAAGVSDERAKENISDADKSVTQFLDALVAKEYDYKNPSKHGEGRRTGIMAQDLEKSDAGKRMVIEHQGTKMVDLTKATMTSLAALASINKRLRNLEK